MELPTTSRVSANRGTRKGRPPGAKEILDQLTNLGSAYNECMSAAVTESPFRVLHKVCSHDCPHSCAVLVTVDSNGRAVKVQGDPSQPVTNGFLCGKVAKYLDRVHEPDRILYPLKRKDGVAKGRLERGHESEIFERVSW